MGHGNAQGVIEKINIFLKFADLISKVQSI